jgi:hypothetical protein
MEKKRSKGIQNHQNKALNTKTKIQLQSQGQIQFLQKIKDQQHLKTYVVTRERVGGL